MKKSDISRRVYIYPYLDTCTNIWTYVPDVNHIYHYFSIFTLTRSLFIYLDHIYPYFAKITQNFTFTFLDIATHLVALHPQSRNLMGDAESVNSVKQLALFHYLASEIHV